jgi:hypothetical protein
MSMPVSSRAPTTRRANERPTERAGEGEKRTDASVDASSGSAQVSRSSLRRVLKRFDV